MAQIFALNFAIITSVFELPTQNESVSIVLAIKQRLKETKLYFFSPRHVKKGNFWQRKSSKSVFLFSGINFVFFVSLRLPKMLQYQDRFVKMSYVVQVPQEFYPKR